MVESVYMVVITIAGVGFTENPERTTRIQLFVMGYKKQAAELFRQSVEAGSKGSTETLEAYYGLVTSPLSA